MYKLLPLFVCLLWSTLCVAQKEKITTVYKDNKLVIEHRVKRGENVFSIARTYHVPPAALSDANGVAVQATLVEGRIMNIPLAVYNHINEEPAYKNDVRELYYKVDGQNMAKVSRITNVPQRKIEKWNNLSDNNLNDGQELMIGWVLYDATPVAKPATGHGGDWSTRQVEQTQMEKDMPMRSLDAAEHSGDSVWTVKVVKPVDTIKTDPNEEVYMRQTLNEQRMITEKGPAVFFAAANNAPKSFYAFHNSAIRGAIIKVYNPGTGKSVFVKVIGTIPATAQYHNSVIGISSAAKRELGIKENKMFCEISYGVL
jgi:LysM repeat protein